MASSSSSPSSALPLPQLLKDPYSYSRPGAAATATAAASHHTAAGGETRTSSGDECPVEELAIELGLHLEQRNEHVGLLEEEPRAPPRRPRSFESRRSAAAAAVGDPFECLCTLLRVPKAIGRNYILYQRPGCLVTVGPHWSGLLFTIGLIITSTYYFIRNVCSPSIAASWVAVAFCICTLGSLLLTGCSNPGFVMASVPESQTRRRFCDQCQIYIGPGTAHCEDCNCCIEQLDHHCPWTGHCIGRKNMSFFITFNCCWVSYVIFVFAMLIVNTKVME